MTLNQLRYFRVLAKTEHYTKAADALAISQPSLSRAIALLEEELGVLLFTRRGRNVVLTDAEGALEALGELNGKRIREDLVDTIFSRFCVGK